MKILFICSSIEAGKDGVGDYVMQLAQEMAKTENQISILAINDRFVKDTTSNKVSNQMHGVDWMRLPADLPFQTKQQVIHDKLKSFEPEWVSLQFVAYAYHPKGLPFDFYKYFNFSEFNGVQWHLMFHELWLGISRVSPLKDKLMGYFQKQIILRLINKSKAKLISTSNYLYQYALNKEGVHSEIMPLFSNIAVAAVDDSFQNQVLSQLRIDDKDRKSNLLMGVFGSIYQASKLEKALYQLIDEHQDKKLNLIGFGKLNPWGKTEFDRLKQVFQNKLQFIHLGLLTEVEVSQVMQMLDLGISCTPYEHIGKSGVYAAFKLHNVEVLVSNLETIPEFDENMKLVYKKFSERSNKQWSVKHVADLILETYQKNANTKKLEQVKL